MSRVASLKGRILSMRQSQLRPQLPTCQCAACCVPAACGLLCVLSACAPLCVVLRVRVCAHACVRLFASLLLQEIKGSMRKFAADLWAPQLELGRRRTTPTSAKRHSKARLLFLKCLPRSCETLKYMLTRARDGRTRDGHFQKRAELRQQRRRPRRRLRGRAESAGSGGERRQEAGGRRQEEEEEGGEGSWRGQVGYRSSTLGCRASPPLCLPPQPCRPA